LKRTVSRPLGKIVLRCLEKDPAKRFASAGELRMALRKVARPPRTSPLKLVAELVLLLAALGALFFYRLSPPAPARSAATPPPSTAATAPPGSASAAPPPPTTESATTPPPSTVRAAPRPQATPQTARREDAEELAWRRKALPLTFTAKHSH